MEDALWPLQRMVNLHGMVCLNPCCNGRCSLTSANFAESSSTKSLNPCCNGRCSLTGSKGSQKGQEPHVLILVVMEDALWRRYVTCQDTIGVVLILVVMEDALWRSVSRREGGSIACLNPCCNGRCSLTKVLLLVWNRGRIVLILVVMEDALWQKFYRVFVHRMDSLNPCCNGRCSLT